METGNSQTPDVTDSSNAPPLLVLTVNSQSSTETFAQKTAFRLRPEQGKSQLVNLEQEHGPRGEKPHAAVTGWMVPPAPHCTPRSVCGSRMPGLRKVAASGDRGPSPAALTPCSARDVTLRSHTRAVPSSRKDLLWPRRPLHEGRGTALSLE